MDLSLPTYRLGEDRRGRPRDVDGPHWSPLIHLGQPINSDAFEYGATVSPDGQWLWFTSHREGSADLYRIATASIPELMRALRPDRR